ncbi:hypothetical protein V6N13_128187 [Hibiscus sabdariffa]
MSLASSDSMAGADHYDLNDFVSCDLLHQAIPWQGQAYYIRLQNHSSNQSRRCDECSRSSLRCVENKAMFYSLDPRQNCNLSTSGVNYAREKVHR